MNKKVTKTAGKTLRKAPESISLEDNADWVETGETGGFEVEIPTGGKTTSTTVTIQTDLLYALEEMLLEYKMKTRINISRSKLLRVWMYGLLNTEDAFKEKFLAAESENEMLDVLLKQLAK